MINNKGKIKVKTLKKGNNLGAKKGKTYAIIVTTRSTIFKKRIILFNQVWFFIGVYFPSLKRNSFSSFDKLS